METRDTENASNYEKKACFSSYLTLYSIL
jgi:hypothetical protein